MKRPYLKGQLDDSRDLLHVYEDADWVDLAFIAINLGIEVEVDSTCASLKNCLLYTSPSPRD